MYEAISEGRTVDAGIVAVAESHGLSTAAADRQPKHLNPNLSVQVLIMILQDLII